MKIVEMMEKIVNICCRLVFRSAYLDGFSDEPTEKDVYILSPLFPNEESRQLVDKFIEESR